MKIESLCGLVYETYSNVADLQKEVDEMVGNRLQDFRKAWRLSKQNVAKTLLMSGEAYDDLESNKAVPSEEEIAQIASLLGVSQEFLEAGEYDIRWLQGRGHKYLVHTPKGWACTQKSCGWRQNCGGGKFYCPGAGCMKEWQENKESASSGKGEKDENQFIP